MSLPSATPTGARPPSDAPLRLAPHRVATVVRRGCAVARDPSIAVCSSCVLPCIVHTPSTHEEEIGCHFVTKSSIIRSSMAFDSIWQAEAECNQLADEILDLQNVAM